MISCLIDLFKKKPPEAQASVSSYVQPGDICIDCGANIGLVTAQMVEAGGIVYAFEPNPHAFAELQRRFRNHESVHLFQKGVWDRPSTMNLYLHEWSDDDEVKWSTGSSLLPFKKNVREDKSIEVEIIDLISFIRELKKPVGVLKIDIEGAEVEVLNRIIEDRAYEQIRWIFAETHDHKIPELKEGTDRIRKEIKRRKIKNIHLDWI